MLFSRRVHMEADDSEGPPHVAVSRHVVRRDTTLAGPGEEPHVSADECTNTPIAGADRVPRGTRRKALSGMLNESHDGACLDAMKSSSPPHIGLSKDFISDLGIGKNNAAHDAWMMQCPSALSSFKQITNHAKYKKIVLFLDYDGTLSHIVDNPEHAFMSNAMRTAVKNVAKYFSTAIISGRSCHKVYKFVKLGELYYAGSHGMDIMGPVMKNESISDLPGCTISIEEQGNEVILFQPAKDFLLMINEVQSLLKDVTKDIEGVIVESNKFCVSVHYRLVDEKDWPKVVRCVHHVLKDYPHLQVTHGRRVLEVRPAIDWNKGKAVEFLLEYLGLRTSDDVLPIYVGDDRTDEDAFKILRESKRGYGILVTSVPKQTNAVFSLRDPTEVKKFLELLVKWKKLEAS
ncbi:hypothetical protein OPV22_003680 [Ensete ventricosum]|uniref:Trehalose 6-phosphate phosphatase n=1 Tax=Ensete ventricosum TaxID=4639 RepID=A0AAV8S1L7_ENSVE|nr:hypothetical protein OPV22_003680 [Ensete ventricosum]